MTSVKKVFESKVFKCVIYPFMLTIEKLDVIKNVRFGFRIMYFDI